MTSLAPLWFLFNPNSGSADPGEVAAIQAALAEAGLPVEGVFRFPEDDLPDIAALDARGVNTLAIFAGDGTINSVVAKLAGWRGTLLILPGGTMNLLSQRLHGDRDARDIAARLGRGEGRSIHPTVIESRCGTALAGIITGPGAAWADVREAVRDMDVAEVVTATSAAIGEATGGPRVICADPRCGDEDGYQSIVLSAGNSAITANGYMANTFGEYLQQGIAIFSRSFREGPHESLGQHKSLTLRSSDESEMGLLIDGEPCEAGASETFTIGRSKVAMLATDPQSD